MTNHQHKFHSNNNAPKIESGITMLFGMHGTDDDILWRASEIEAAIRSRPSAGRHLLVAECGIPSSLPSSPAELQQMYDQARKQHAQLPSINWGMELSQPSLTSGTAQLLRNFHAAGINEFIERCDKCPDGSHEFGLRQGVPNWLPISELISHLRAEGKNVKCGFELMPLDAYALGLKNFIIEESFQQAWSSGTLLDVLNYYAKLMGLTHRSDIVRDRGVAEVTKGYLANNPTAHIVVERGTAHRTNLESLFGELGMQVNLKQRASPLDISYSELKHNDFWEDADERPTAAHLGQAFRAIMRDTAIADLQSDDSGIIRISQKITDIPEPVVVQILGELGPRKFVDCLSSVFTLLEKAGFEIGSGSITNASMGARPSGI
jgi:hypothetical protein